MFQTFISRHNSNFFSDKLVLTSVTPASSAPVLQTPKATSSTLYFDSLTVNAGNGGFLHCIQMDTSVNAANQVVSVGADIAFDADPKFFACLVRFESSSVPTTLPTAYDVYPLDGRHDGGYYTVKDCVTIFFFSSRRRHTRLQGDWSSDVCSSDLSRRCSACSTAFRRPASAAPSTANTAPHRARGIRTTACGSNRSSQVDAARRRRLSAAIRKRPPSGPPRRPERPGQRTAG